MRFIKQRSIKITEKIAIFGFKNSDIVGINQTDVDRFNVLILIAKYCIVKHKFGNQSNITIIYENEKRMRNI